MLQFNSHLIVFYLLESPALDLLVLSLEEVRGLFITRCQMQPLTSEVNEETLVLFSQANGRQLKLGLRSRVRVHPPWYGNN